MSHRMEGQTEMKQDAITNDNEGSYEDAQSY